MGLKLYTESSGSNRKLKIKYVKLTRPTSRPGCQSSLLQAESLDVRSESAPLPPDQPGCPLHGGGAALRHRRHQAAAQAHRQPPGSRDVRCAPGPL